MDRLDVCRWIQVHWEEIQMEAIRRTTAMIMELEADDICNRFMLAGKKYGSFKLNAIDTQTELMQEFCDIPSYIAIERLQEERP